MSGERRLPELELSWLPGYENSRPVRVGNAAVDQLQLDVYGELTDALYTARRVGMSQSENAWRVQCKLIEWLERNWTQPDEGIWEVRGPRRHFTHSKVMCWVALDRMVKLVEEFGAPRTRSTAGGLPVIDPRRGLREGVEPGARGASPSSSGATHSTRACSSSPRWASSPPRTRGW